MKEGVLLLILFGLVDPSDPSGGMKFLIIIVIRKMTLSDNVSKVV
jgi:hypothetical protein